ncbi:MAG: M20 family peptidase [Clostridia bacterium]|nr:M20 family peptidase [Clostridia bacterium]
MNKTTAINYIQAKERLAKNIDEHESICVELSRELMNNPEISGEEFASSKLIVQILTDHGYEVEYPLEGVPTAFRAIYGSNTHSRKMVIMSEYDALPKIGHACGHNVSAAISLLAALSLRSFQDELDCDIHIIGTPAEEHGGSKVTLIEKGVFSEYDMAMLVHLYDTNVLSPVCLALRGNTYTFHGKAAHGAASPWDGKNALNGVQLMLHAIDMMRQHVKPDVRLHGIIKDGGLIPNTVPEKASCEYYVRSLNKDYADEIQQRVDDCAKGAAIATQTTVEKVPSTNAYSDLKRNEAGLQCLEEVFSELQLCLDEDQQRVFASTDAGNVSYVCPTFHPCLSIAPAGTPLHTSAFAECAASGRAEKAIIQGSFIIGLQTIKIFGDERLLARVKEDFKK